MTATALAEILHVSPNTVTNYCATAILPDQRVVVELERLREETRRLVLGNEP